MAFDALEDALGSALVSFLTGTGLDDRSLIVFSLLGSAARARPSQPAPTINPTVLLTRFTASVREVREAACRPRAAVAEQAYRCPAAAAVPGLQPGPSFPARGWRRGHTYWQEQSAPEPGRSRAGSSAARARPRQPVPGK